MTSSLANKTALITGAGSGIGRSTAIALSKLGATVMLIARRKTEIEAAAAEIVQAGGHAIAMVCDIAKTPEIDRCVQKCLTDTGRPGACPSNRRVATA